jgi:maltoporin
VIGLVAVAAVAGSAGAESPAPTQTAGAPASATAAAADGFSLGSYGRLVIGTDLRGGTPEAIAVVGHGPRVVERSYVEIDLRYRQRATDRLVWRTVTTLAFSDELFHYSGEFRAALALRNLYAEAIAHDRVGLWVGSRMVRGDDIYLLDTWPLYDANMVGGGAWWRGERVEAMGYVGANRLRDDYQFQEIEVPDPWFGARTIVQLDRQRALAGLVARARILGVSDAAGLAATLHGAIAALPDGTRRRGDNTLEELPDDRGWTVGAQLTGWGLGDRANHGHLFLRLSRGLSAFDELTVPYGLDSEKRAAGASELLAGASAAYAVARGGVLAGGYARRFVDADAHTDDLDDGWELIADVRPYGHVTPTLQAAIDVSYQQRFPRGVSPAALEVLSPTVWQIAPMAIFSPRGPGAFTRPHFRLVYRAAHLDRGARDLYALEDSRHGRTWAHFLGFQVEWWVDSSYR